MTYPQALSFGRQKEINQNLIDAYYRRVVSIERSDEAFLSNICEGVRLLYKLSPADLIDFNLLKAIVYNRIISSQCLSESLRLKIISAVNYDNCQIKLITPQKVNQFASAASRINRNFIKAMPYEAAAAVLAIYLSFSAIAGNASALPSPGLENISAASNADVAITEISSPNNGLTFFDQAIELEFPEPQSTEASTDILLSEDFRLDEPERPAPSTNALIREKPAAIKNGLSLLSASEYPTAILKDNLEISLKTAKAFSSLPEESSEIIKPVSPEFQSESSTTPASVISARANAHSDSGYYNIALSHELQDYTRSVCESNDFPFEYALALMYIESHYQANASSGTGDHGIMQINSCNHDWLRQKFGVTDFYDPEQNIICGVYMISDAYHKYGDFHKALMAYNMGDYNASQLWKQGIYTSNYSRSVISALDTLTQTGTLA